MKRVAVIVFPGSNCDADALAAARDAGSRPYQDRVARARGPIEAGFRRP